MSSPSHRASREALFRDENNGFILYLSDGANSSDMEERIIRLEMREALIWLNETPEDGGAFWNRRETGNRSMRDVHKIIDVSVSTISTSPLRGIVEIDTADSTIKFELTEDIAHSICTDLERFLTQEQLPGKLTSAAQPVIQSNRTGRPIPCWFMS